MNHITTLPTDAEAVLLPREAAALLRISLTQLRLLTASGLPSYSFRREGTDRGSRRYLRSDLLAFMEKHRQPAPAV